MGVSIPIEYLYITVGLLVVAVIYIINDKNNARLYNPEGPLFVKARKKEIPILRVIDPGTNHARHILGDKERDDDPVYAKDMWGLHADPAYIEGDASPERHPGGLLIYNISPNVTFPISPRNVLAQHTILRHRRDLPEFADLDFLSDRDLLVLLSSPSDHLPHDAQIFTDNYKPTIVEIDESGQPVEVEMNAADLVDRITAFRKYATTLPVEGGGFAYHEYFRNNPYGHSSQTTQRINHLFQRIADRKSAMADKLWTYGLIAIGLLGAVGVTIYIISLAAG